MNNFHILFLLVSAFASTIHAQKLANQTLITCVGPNPFDTCTLPDICFENVCRSLISEQVRPWLIGASVVVFVLFCCAGPLLCCLCKGVCCCARKAVKASVSTVGTVVGGTAGVIGAAASAAATSTQKSYNHTRQANYGSPSYETERVDYRQPKSEYRSEYRDQGRTERPPKRYSYTNPVGGDGPAPLPKNYRKPVDLMDMVEIKVPRPPPQPQVVMVPVVPSPVVDPFMYPQPTGYGNTVYPPTTSPSTYANPPNPYIQPPQSQYSSPYVPPAQNPYSNPYPPTTNPYVDDVYGRDRRSPEYERKKNSPRGDYREYRDEPKTYHRNEDRSRFTDDNGYKESLSERKYDKYYQDYEGGERANDRGYERADDRRYERTDDRRYERRDDDRKYNKDGRWDDNSDDGRVNINYRDRRDDDRRYDRREDNREHRRKDREDYRNRGDDRQLDGLDKHESPDSIRYRRIESDKQGEYNDTKPLHRGSFDSDDSREYASGRGRSESRISDAEEAGFRKRPPSFHRSRNNSIASDTHTKGDVGVRDSALVNYPLPKPTKL